MCMLEKNKHIYPPLKQNIHTHTHTHTHTSQNSVTISTSQYTFSHQFSQVTWSTCIISPLITILTFKPNMLHNFAKLHIHGHTLQTLILQKSRSGFCRAQLQHFDYHGFLTLSVAAMLRIWQLTRYWDDHDAYPLTSASLSARALTMMML